MKVKEEAIGILSLVDGTPTEAFDRKIVVVL